MHWMRSLGTARRVVALDIGSHSVKLVALRHPASGPRLDAVAQDALPPDVMHGHAVRHPETVGAVIRTLLRRAGGRGTVRTAIPGPAVMMRRLTVRGATRAELDAAVVREVGAHVPAPLEQTVLDYHLLGPPAPDGAVAVLAVAARRDLVQSYTAAIRAAGVEPAAVDVDVFALDRLLREFHRDDGEVVLVHAGARYAGISRLRSDGPLWVADVPTGADVEPDALARAVDRSLDLFSPEAPAPPVGVLLSGGVASAPGLAPAFAARFACPVEVIDPLARIAARRRVDRGPEGSCGPAFAVAVGLALRPPEDSA